jgi:hypothetical protein
MNDRTTQGLRDILFDEIDELRSGKGDAAKSMAVANLAKQIINTAKVELDFMRTLKTNETNKPPELGNLVLGRGISDVGAESAGRKHSQSEAAQPN